VNSYEQIVRHVESDVPFATAVVLKAEGSTPQKVGARAVIAANGALAWGTIGGGVVDAEARRRAVEACKTGYPLLFDISLHGGVAAEAGPICGGAMSILIDPTGAKDHAAYSQAGDALRRRERGTLLTTIRLDAGAAVDTNRLDSGAIAETNAQWIAEGAIVSFSDFPGAEALRACFAREAPALFVNSPESQARNAASQVAHQKSDILIPKSHPPHSSPQASNLKSEISNLKSEIPSPQSAIRNPQSPISYPFSSVPCEMALVEPVIANPLLLVVGGGHVGQAVARQAILVGFDITVLDDRSEFCNPALFPDGVATRCGDPAKEVAAFPMGKDTFVVIVTRGHERDAEALEACIHAPAAYAGMIGSRRKVAMMREDFIKSGRATPEEFDRVHAPIGLDIGAVTVPEIAASIVAQLIAVRRKGVGALKVMSSFLSSGNESKNPTNEKPRAAE